MYFIAFESYSAFLTQIIKLRTFQSVDILLSYFNKTNEIK